MTAALTVFAAAPPVLDVQRQGVEGPTTALFGVLGVATLVFYVLAIRRGFVEKYTVLPLFVVCTNVSWEFVFSFVYPLEPKMRIIVLCWLPLNLVLLFIAFRYGRKDFAGMSRAVFGWMGAGWIAFSVSFLILLTREFDDRLAVYSQVFVALFMEAMFVVLIRQRRSTAGQTMYFGLLKMLVDLCGGIALLLWYPNRWLLAQMVVAELVLDVLYLVLLYRLFKAENRSPWRKV